MRYRFTIVKPIGASRSNVIANYLDLEHLSFHSGLSRCRVISETERTACFELTSKVGPLRVRNVHYYEFRPPNQIFHAIKSPLGPMYVTSTVEELGSGTPEVRSEVTVETMLELPRPLYPFRGLLGRLLRRLNRTVLQEDLEILERRHALFGDYVEDYLRERQRILFKEAFRACYGRTVAGPPEAAADSGAAEPS